MPLSPSAARPADYLHLHLIVLIWGFTGVVGVLIKIPALELVFLRTFSAALLTGLWMLAEGKSILIPRREAIRLFAAGLIIALHWLTFFVAARISNVSTCLAGLATCTFFTGIFGPLFTGRKFRSTELLFGLVAAAGLYLIFQSDTNSRAGLGVGILSAAFAAAFSTLNGMFVQKHPARIISLYELTGASVFSGIGLAVWYVWFAPAGENLSPSLNDWLLLLFLSAVCTVYAFSAAVQLLRRFSVFAMNLTINLEPVYGIILAFVFFGEKERMQGGFYAGTCIVLLSVLCFPWVEKRFGKSENAREVRT